VAATTASAFVSSVLAVASASFGSLVDFRVSCLDNLHDANRVCPLPGREEGLLLGTLDVDCGINGSWKFIPRPQRLKDWCSAMSMKLGSSLAKTRCAVASSTTPSSTQPKGPPLPHGGADSAPLPRWIGASSEAPIGELWATGFMQPSSGFRGGFEACARSFLQRRTLSSRKSLTRFGGTGFRCGGGR